ILEDDCLPDLSFFSFTRELLIKYQYENRIMHIGGDNFQNGKYRTDASYYFYKLTHLWGWDTWRRAWNGYSSSLENFSEKELKTILDQLFSNWNQKQVFIDKFELLKLNKINTWDYQWMFHVWRKNGLAIIPNVNLVKNIGFGENATHTSEK